jgi:hypothetical protein
MSSNACPLYLFACYLLLFFNIKHLINQRAGQVRRLLSTGAKRRGRESQQLLCRRPQSAPARLLYGCVKNPGTSHPGRLPRCGGR